MRPMSIGNHMGTLISLEIKELTIFIFLYESMLYQHKLKNTEKKSQKTYRGCRTNFMQ